MEHAKKFVLIDPVAYTRMKESHAQAAAISAIQPRVFQADVKDILDGNESDDIKAKQYQMAMKKFHVCEPAKQVETSAVDESNILEYVSSSVRHKAKRLVQIVKDSPSLTWNERGELIHKQTTVSGSNIVDLVNDIIKHKRLDEERPIGWQEFALGLSESKEINKDLVGNYGSWKVIRRRRPRETPVARQSSEERGSRTRERTARERSRMPTRISNWEEY